MITAIAPWFGSNRLLANQVGEAMEGCSWVGVPFAGGMCEVAHLSARTIVVNDLHRHIMNLAATIRTCREKMQETLSGLPFHPDTLQAAQFACLNIEAGAEITDYFQWAVDYFVCAWMARSATAGTSQEFQTGLSLRWEAAGGDSAKRFYNAVAGLTAWQTVMRRCTFSTLDFFAWLAKVKDRAGHGVYCDPPFPGPGDAYKHTFDEDMHRRMAKALAVFKQCRVVCRFYDVPLIREIYPEPLWTWQHLAGRTQTNAAAREVLLRKG